MQDIVQSYLSRHYFVNTSDAGNDGIYELNDTRRHKVPIYGDKLLYQLSIIFSLEADLLKDWVNLWVVSLNSDIDLDFYWLENEAFFDALNIHLASIINPVLAPVQPMGAPTGTLFYLDYVYSGTPTINLEISN